MTPRKTSKRQQNHQSQPTPLAQASDYDSDVQYFVPPPQRTNDEINLLVLRRYNPAIQTPLSIVANAVVYSFKDDPPAWEKPGIDGSLFVCQLEPHPITGGERYCLALLNRRGLENLMLELGELMEVENTPELLTLRYIEKVPGGGPDGPEKVIGLWMHADKDDTREKNGLLIEDLWKKAVKAKEAEVLAEGNGKQRAGASSTESWNMVEHQPEMSNQPGPSALGRKLSIRDLFAQKSVELPPGIAANPHRNY